MTASDLEHVLAKHFGVHRPIVEMDRSPLAYQSSFAIEELRVRFDDRTRLQLILKDLSRQALLEEARRAKPEFLYDPLREIETYERLLARAGLGSPTYYGSVIDSRSGRYWLLIEMAPGVALYQVGNFLKWRHVAAWLARMHIVLSRYTRVACAARLLRYDGRFYRQWPLRAIDNLSKVAGGGGLERMRQLEWLSRRWDRVVEGLLELPVTCIHGEFYPSNVLISDTPAGCRVCPVDWEMAAIGPALADLAALTLGRWTESERSALSEAYRLAMAAEGGSSVSSAAFSRQLALCRLQACMQWLGWSHSWSPPPQHAQDWLEEAVRVARALRL